MFTRFQMNVRRYPKIFTVLCLAFCVEILADMGIGRLVGETAHQQGVSFLYAVGIDFFLAAITYVWFMGDSNRVVFLLEMMDKIEGRKNRMPSCEGGDPCEDYGQDGTECEESSLIDDEEGQDVAEYAVMLAVILAIALGTIHLIGSSSSNVFSQIGSSIQ